jgi:hypothetical protein
VFGELLSGSSIIFRIYKVKVSLVKGERIINKDWHLEIS